jgi:hypothetical protein
VAWQDEADLVPALGAVLVSPELLAARAQGGPLHVAMTQAPDLRQGPRRLDEGVVGGDPAILVQAHRLAEVVVQRLGLLPLAVAIPRVMKR